MLKQLFYYFLVLTISVSTIGCEGCQNTEEPAEVETLEKEKTLNGFDFVFHIQNEGPKAQIGEYAYYNLEIYGIPESGIPMFFEAGEDFRKIVDPKDFGGFETKNPMIDILPLLSIGDSVTIFHSPDSIINLSPTYGGLEMFEYKVTLTSIGTPEQHTEKQKEIFNKRKAHLLEARTRLDEINNFCLGVLNDYKAGKINNLVEKKSGLKYVIHEEGKGDNYRNGNVSNFFYTGVLMDGTFFDNTFESGLGTTIQVGREQSLPAWDEAMLYLKRGAKVSLFVPYPLLVKADGTTPNIPQDAEVMFYLEMME